jgi:hypothetical protein
MHSGERKNKKCQSASDSILAVASPIWEQRSYSLALR